MHDVCTYTIEVTGEVDEAAINADSPLNVRVVNTDQATTRLIAQADQSALVGLIRHLHQRGFTFLSVSRESFFQEQ